MSDPIILALDPSSTNMGWCIGGKHMSDPIILALDPSSTNVGWCVGQGDQYIASGVFKPVGKGATQRVMAIVEWADAVIIERDPDLIALEEPMGSHANLKTDRLLARVYGNLECLGILRGIEVKPYHPSTVKKTGFHKKSLVLTAAYIGKSDIGQDEADAVGVWTAALNEMRAVAILLLTQSQREG